MLSEVPTTIFVPNGNYFSEDDDDHHIICDVEDDTVCSDDDDLSLTREMAREQQKQQQYYGRTAPDCRRAPLRTVSLESKQRGPCPLRTISTTSTSESCLRRTPFRTVSTESLRHSAPVPRQVSPTCVPREIAVPVTMASSPLQDMYRQGLKKLAKSMQHSDMTRSAIKRQSKFSYRHGATNRTDFFLSTRCQELEDCRRQVWKMIAEQR